MSPRCPDHTDRQRASRLTLAVERIAVVVVAGGELEHDVGLPGLDLVERQLAGVTPDSKSTMNGVAGFCDRQVRREIINSVLHTLRRISITVLL